MPEMPLRPTGGTQTHPGRARKQNWILQYTNTKGAFIFWNSYVKFVKKTKLEKKSFLTLNYQTTPAKKRRTKRLTPFKDHPSAQVLINWGTMLHEILVSFHRLSKKIHFAKSSLQKPRQGVFPVSPTCLLFCRSPESELFVCLQSGPNYPPCSYYYYYYSAKTLFLCFSPLLCTRVVAIITAG